MQFTAWYWVALASGFAIILMGMVGGRSLAQDRRLLRQRKFLAVGLIPIILVFLFSRPIVFPWTGVWSERDTASTLTSVDDVSRRSVEQQRDIKNLQNEIEKLRAELASVNDYYGWVTSSMLTVALVVCFLYPLKRRKEDIDAVEDSPLGLN
jgi:amino acid transporter